ncbi:methyl-accepting chemotaxis protein [Geomonas sp. Red276]
MKLVTKVGTTVVVVFAVTILALIVTAFSSSRSIMASVLETQQLNLAKDNAGNIDTWLQSKLAIIDAAGKDLSKYPVTQHDHILNQVKVLSAAGNFKKVYTGYEDGTVIFSDDWKAPADYDPRKRPWYTQTKAAPKTSFTEPYIASSTGKLTLSFMSPLLSNGALTGVVSSDIALDEIIEKVLHIKLGKSGYAFVVDKAGKIVIHPKQDYVMKQNLADLSPDLKGVADKLSTSKTSLLSYRLDGSDKIMSYAEIPSTGWYLCVSVDRSEVFAPVGKQLTALAIIGLLFLVAGVAVVSLFIRGLLRPVSVLCDRVSDIAEGYGDLTRKLDLGDRKDEIGVLAGKINHFVESVREIVLQIANASSMLATDSERLSSIATTISSGTEEVASQTTTVATASEEMSATASDIASNCLSVAENAKLAADTTHEGFDVVSSTLDGIRSRGEITRQTARAISSLGERSEQIGAIVSTIEDIADQTNLLALNAAIEAARAGEQGRGFAVVADEVRALAERTTKATKEISEMIRAIQQETRVAMTAMDEGVIAAEKGIEEAARIETSLKRILDQVEAVTAQVNQIATAAEEQTAVTNEITGNIQNVTSVLHHTTQEAKTVATTSAHVSDVAGRLHGIVGKFKL